MTLIPMTEAEIAALNAAYDRRDADDDIHAVARQAGLSLVKRYEESGGLYRDPATGRCVFAWDAPLSPGFDDQIEDDDLGGPDVR